MQANVIIDVGGGSNATVTVEPILDLAHGFRWRLDVPGEESVKGEARTPIQAIFEAGRAMGEGDARRRAMAGLQGLSPVELLAQG